MLNMADDRYVSARSSRDYIHKAERSALSDAVPRLGAGNMWFLSACCTEDLLSVVEKATGHALINLRKVPPSGLPVLQKFCPL